MLLNMASLQSSELAKELYTYQGQFQSRVIEGTGYMEYIDYQ